MSPVGAGRHLVDIGRPEDSARTTLDEMGEAGGEGLRAFLAQYAEASEAYRGGNLKALSWFPPDCYPPALRFLGIAAPPRPPSPPTRRITVLESGKMERGEVPVVTIAVRTWHAEQQSIGTVWDDEPRARGQPG